MEANINMRIFKSILIVIGIAIVSVKSTPLLHYTRDRDSRPERNDAIIAESKKEPIEHYDQRQNGTENYRVKVDGLVFILAPADTLLLGAALEPNFTTLLGEANKPKPKPKPEQDELLKPKPEKEDIPKAAQQEPVRAAHKSALRITNLIAPFLNRIRHTQQLLE